MSGRQVVVVGGGLGGLAAAISCADAGAAVTVLEGRPRLGGATWSFTRNGLSFDNGQHVHLRCCEEYRGFLERLGTEELAPFAGRLAIPVVSDPASGRARRVAWIRRDRLPAPLHLARALASYGHLSVRERLRLAAPALLLRRTSDDDASLDERSFGSFLDSHHQSERARTALWDLVTLPTTNLRSPEVSLLLAAKVFRTGLLSSSSAGDIAWARVPLAELHVEPARRLLCSLGGSVRLGTRVSSLKISESTTGAAPRIRAVELEDGEVIETDAVVMAVPHEDAAGLLPPGAISHQGEIGQLGSVPIVNVHFVFSSKIMDFEMAAAIDSPAQFLFDRTAASGLSGDQAKSAQVLAVSLSGAAAEIGRRPQELIDVQLATMRRLFPAARSAEVLDAVVTREHRATFRGSPGSAALRPGPKTAYSNLAIAGAWTDTKWPATMEGAVRSGRAAARVVLDALGATTDVRATASEEVSA